MPKWGIPISMDRLMTTLELAETRAEATQKINTDPPIIIFMTEPAVLITLDGKENLQEIEGSKLKRVITRSKLDRRESAVSSSPSWPLRKDERIAREK